MLDSSTSAHSWACAEWQNQVSYGDIVLFRFPIAGQSVSKALPPRPCLVLDIELVAGRRCAVLVPATPARRPVANQRAVSVGRRADYRAAGLDRPTLFNVRARQVVPLEHDGFIASGETGSPILGRLPDAAMERMHAERARLHALRDIRAHREETGRHRPRCRGPVRGRDFTVERRNPRRPIPIRRGSAARSGA